MKKLIAIAAFLVTMTGCTTGTYVVPLFEGNCVDRAVAIRQDLKAHGYEAEIVIGTGKLDGKKIAHAWIKYRKPGTDEWTRYENWDAKTEG